MANDDKAGSLLTPPAPGETKPPAGETGKPGGETKPPAGETGKPAGETGKPGGEVKPPAGEAGKPGDGGKVESGKEGGEGKPKEPAGVPESYDVDVPDGYELDEELLDEVAPLAREAGLSQEQFDKLTAAYMAHRQREESKLAEIAAGWADAVKKDPELGGEKYEEKLAIAKKVLNLVGTPELAQLLNQRGLGNHPELVRLCYRMGVKIADDSAPGGGPPGGGAGEAKPEKILYSQVDGNGAAAG